MVFIHTGKSRTHSSTTNYKPISIAEHILRKRKTFSQFMVQTGLDCAVSLLLLVPVFQMNGKSEIKEWQRKKN